MHDLRCTAAEGAVRKARANGLSELQQGDPLMLVLSRGGFCPKERRQQEGLLQLHREMQVGYCRLVTISTDNLLDTNEFRSGVGAYWTFLSDPGRKSTRSLLSKPQESVRGRSYFTQRNVHD